MSEAIAHPGKPAPRGLLLNEAEVMDRSALRALRRSSAALLLSGHLALSTSEAIGLESVLLGIVMLLTWPIGEYLDQKFGRAYRAMTNLLALGIVLLLPLLYARFEQNLLVPVTVLILFIEWHKVIHSKQPKDYYQLFLMTFFILLASCAQSPDASFALALMAYVFSAVWAFFMLQVYIESHANVNHPAADIVGRHGNVSLRTNAKSLLIDWRMIGTMVAVATAAVGLTVGAFVFTPRMEAGLLGASTSTQSIIALDEEVDLAGGGVLQASEEPILRVRFSEEPNGLFPPEKMFWRAVTLDRYQYNQWRRGHLSPYETYDDVANSVYFIQDSPTLVKRNELGSGRVVKQEIFFEDWAADVLPTLPLVMSLSISKSRIQWNQHQDFSVLVDDRRTPVSYVAESELVEFTPEQLRHVRGNPSQPLTPDLVLLSFPTGIFNLLTVDGLGEEVRALAVQLTQDEETIYDKVMAIERYLRGPEFLYTRTVPDMGTVNPMDQFLLVHKRGHCELFASAMALMIRSLDIPTRVVQGYRGGEFSDVDDSYTIRRSMAHLWVEVFFPGYGWITFDPAPEFSEDEDEGFLRSMSRLVSRNIMAARMIWYRDVVAYEGGIRISDLGNYARGIFNLDLDAIRSTALGRRSLTGFMPRLFLIFFVGFIVCWLIVYRFLGREKAAGTLKALVLSPDQFRAVRLFRALRKVLHRHGIECHSRTSGEILAAATASGKFTREDLSGLVETYNLARFGGRGLTSQKYKDSLKRIRSIKPIEQTRMPNA
ncbi:MAG: hypothetical protein AMXMBFR84_37180 [Candidatus Hydrogenedentota bacterium]